MPETSIAGTYALDGAAPAVDAPMLEGELIRLLYQDAGRHELAAFGDHVRALPDSPRKTYLAQCIEMSVTIKERLEQHQLRERGLLAVIETAQDLTAITDLDRVLQAIVQRARKLVGCDVGYLSIYDEQHSDFYVRATDGAFSEGFKQIRVGLEVGVCGFVARNRAPYSSSDYGTDARFQHDHPIDSAMADENVKSILGVPLFAGEKVIGVLFVGDRYVRSYVAWEMSILSTLAAHASVAIANARLFEQAQQALQQASETNALLTRQTVETRAAAEAHEQLTSLVARGGDLRDICDMVADRLGGRVVVCDEGEHEICAAGEPAEAFPALREGCDDRKFWIADRIHAALGESRRLGLSVTAFSRPSHLCRVCAVIGGQGVIGGLIIHTHSQLNDVAVRIFERSATVTGVVLLLKERRESSISSDIPVVLRGLIHQPQASLTTLAARTSAYGLDLASPVCLAALQCDPEQARYAAKQLRLTLKTPGVMLDEVSNMLVCLANETAAAGLRSALTQFFSERRISYAGVISRPAPLPADLPDAFQRSCRCLEFLHALDRTNAILDERDLVLYSSVFGSSASRDIDLFLDRTLGPLYRPEDTRKTELARTLLAYLDAGYNARTAAEALGIHINTFRQRLDAIDVQLADWRASGRALDLHMALRLWSLRDPACLASAGSLTQPASDRE